MNNTYVRFNIGTNAGDTWTYLDLSKIESFRRHLTDCNRTIVITNNREYSIYIKFHEFEDIMKQFFELKIEKNGKIIY